jgi:hypothetical protein
MIPLIISLWVIILTMIKDFKCKETKFIFNGLFSKKLPQNLQRLAEKHGWTDPMVWSLALEGKNDNDRFKKLGWGLRTWDNMCPIKNVDSGDHQSSDP